ncbi:eosinophil cationic protein 1-like [Castor canadensis]|jgi:hypothetical protein|uniref:Ribonuclease A-domain domain-containing protein n=2 Tax=Castor canadensis TaxID=51338 RepID=A0A8C0W281_CASCN
MVAKLLHSQLCLLLLLGLLGIVPLLQAGPHGLPDYEWFRIQHIKNGSIQCNIEMLKINTYTRICKGFNTFLNINFTDAVNVCNNPVTMCHEGKSQNCHNSSVPVSITDCNLISPSDNITQCKYSRNRSISFYRIACDPITPQVNDTLVPVHLDGTF